jgi:hypothetical protein
MENKYTEKEVQRNLNILTKTEDDLLQQRKAINQELSRNRKQIEYWKELDLSQLRIL